MQDLYFYPKLTPELKEACGYSSDKYSFSYEYQGEYHGLRQKGSSTLKLSDPLEIWKIETEGIRINKNVRIAYPQFLYGKDGIACQGAELGICITWTNKALTQTGIILPVNDVTLPQGRSCKFEFSFAPGTILGDLELSLNLYIKKSAAEILPNEDSLMNEAGVSVGELETVVLDFSSIYMEFPIEEFKSEKEPLWWVEFSQWEDPKVSDLFTRDNVCLYLNPYYSCCPAPSTSGDESTIKNLDLLIDILAQTYMLMFTRLSEDDLRATQQDIGLSPNSICSILHQFIEECEEELHFETPEALLKSLQINIRKKLEATDNG